MATKGLPVIVRGSCFQNLTSLPLCECQRHSTLANAAIIYIYILEPGIPHTHTQKQINVYIKYIIHHPALRFARRNVLKEVNKILPGTPLQVVWCRWQIFSSRLKTAKYLCEIITIKVCRNMQTL